MVVQGYDRNLIWQISTSDFNFDDVVVLVGKNNEFQIESHRAQRQNFFLLKCLF